jgi:hypothetical protein
VRTITCVVAALIVVAAFNASSFGQETSVSLDRVEGGRGDIIPAGDTAIFDLRLTNFTEWNFNINMGFRIWSPDSAEWSYPLRDTTYCVDLGPMWCHHMPGPIFSIDSILADEYYFSYARFSTTMHRVYFSPDGAGADTLGYAAAANRDSLGLSANWTGVLFRIPILTRAEDVGKTICIDSSWFPPGGSWKWASINIGGPGHVTPDWSGPHCFTLIDCSVGPDRDQDGIADTCDVCDGHDDNLDADRDGIPDDCDICYGYNDRTDTDGDGVPNGCDICEGSDDSDLSGPDADGDGIPDACDECPGADDSIDSDGDHVADDCDICPGFPDNLDADYDGVPDGCDSADGQFVSLERVPPSFDFEYLPSGIVCTLQFRVCNGENKKYHVTNAFRVWSPDGANWSYPARESTPVGGGDYIVDSLLIYNNFGNMFDAAGLWHYENVDGTAVDTLIFWGTAQSTLAGLQPSWTNVALGIPVLCDFYDAGKHICIDTLSELGTSSGWQWTNTAYQDDDVTPNWSGPHCFEILPTCCMNGMSGNIDYDSLEVVDIGDVTHLIQYLYLSGTAPICESSANTDGDDEARVDVADLVSLIDFLHISRTPLAPCR